MTTKKEADEWLKYVMDGVEELKAIEAEHPDLYEALAKDDPSLIK